MTTIVTRAGKGSPLTWNEVDNNFTNLNSAKYESGNNAAFGTLSSTGNTYLATSSGNVGIGTSSPSTKLQVTIAPSSAADDGMRVTDGTRIIQTNITGSAYSYIGIGASETMLYSTGNPLNIVSDGQPIKFIAGTAERMRIDSSGNVGIGTSSPSSLGNLVVSAVTDPVIALEDQGAWNASIKVIGASGALTFNNSASTERMRIDSSGNLCVGTTGFTGAAGFSVAPNYSNGSATAVFNRANTASTSYAFYFQNNASTVGSISYTNTATAFTTSSDYRLKDNVTPMTGALDKIALLKPVTYKWKVDGSDGEGFIAHELQEIVPHAVTGEKDAVDEEGNPVYQGIDTSFLVATLTAAIQEQQELIKQLQADVALLKGN